MSLETLQSWFAGLPVRFENPWWLLALLSVAVSVLISARSLAGMARWRRRVALWLRIGLLVAVSCALAGMTVLRTEDSLCVFFLVDGSRSVGEGQREMAVSAIREATSSMRRGRDRMGVIVFGEEASLETSPSYSPTVDQLQTVATPEQTDISQAIRLALASFPSGSAKRIVLLSDGNETLGRALEEARVANANEVPIDVVRLHTPYEKEAAVESLLLPPRAKLGEPFDLKLVVSALSAGEGTLYVYRNSQLYGQNSVTWGSGKNVFRLRQSLEEAGFWNYEIRLVTEDDTLVENNRAMGFTHIAGEPRALLCTGDADADASLVQALGSGHIDVDVVGPGGIPTELDMLVQYDAIVFSDIPATAMVTSQMELIRAACRDLGIGFLMIGGQEGFGAGGYYKTPIEETLPVSMDITHKQHFPSTSLVIVVDTSGSMGAIEGGKTKIEIANEAACLAAELLTERDELAVVGVDTQAQDVLPLGKVTDIDEAKRKIRTMGPGGGGILVDVALKYAYDLLLNKSEGQIRHVICLADGSDSENMEGMDDLARKMLDEQGVTTTFVSLGDGPHTPGHRQITAVSGGRTYVAKRMEDVPRIYTKETLLVARSLLCEEVFLPAVDAAAPPLRGIDWESCPPLLGYVGTTEKPTSQVFMRTHKDDPLFASWQYGLGRSLAFTSDARARWAAEWIEWPAYPKFWQQSVRWMLRTMEAGALESTVSIERGEGVITVEALGSEDEFLNFLDIRARLVNPAGEGKDLKLEQIAPGRYQQSFDARDVGAYMANITYTLPDGAQHAQTAGSSVPYPEEYKRLEMDDFTLTRIAEVSGGVGREPTELAGIFDRARHSVRTPSPVWPALLLAAAIAFPFDIAIRRLVLDRRQWEMAMEHVAVFKAKVRSAREAASARKPSEGTLEALLTVKHGETTESTPAEPSAPPVETIPVRGAASPETLVEQQRLREQLAAASAKARAAAPPASSEGPPGAEPPPETDTFSRLMAAKKRVNR